METHAFSRPQPGAWFSARESLGQRYKNSVKIPNKNFENFSSKSNKSLIWVFPVLTPRDGLSPTRTPDGISFSSDGYHLTYHDLLNLDLIISFLETFAENWEIKIWIGIYFYIWKSLDQKTTHQTVYSRLWPLGIADPRILGSGTPIGLH